MTDSTKPESTLKRIAVMNAHPDDAEFGCGASIAKWASEGAHITIVLLTNGDKGSDDRSISSPELARIRQAEQLEAAKILGVADVIFMGHPDCMLVPNLELRKELVRIIRRIKPDLIVCSDPNTYFGGSNYINHPDHRAAGVAVLEAIFPASQNHRVFPELLDEGLEPHRVKEVYTGGWETADFYVDVSAFLEAKVEALRAHKSQMGDWDPNDEVRKWAAETGKKHEPPLEAAESFRRIVLNDGD